MCQQALKVGILSKAAQQECHNILLICTLYFTLDATETVQAEKHSCGQWIPKTNYINNRKSYLKAIIQLLLDE